MNNQSIYCAGGTGEGFSNARAVFQPLNNQVEYCTGGDDDGQSLAWPALTTYNNQGLYCSGGRAEGADLFHLEMVTLNNYIACCLGGIQDGAASFSIFNSINEHLPYCSGGTADGWSSAFIQGWMFTHDYCLGGSGDGWNPYSTGTLTFNNQAIYSVSGPGDGWHCSLSVMSSMNTQDLYCKAGNKDGYDCLSFIGSLQSGFLYCTGGSGDGFQGGTSSLHYLGYGIWTGAASNIWTMPTNWKYNTVPDSLTGVVIRAGASFYPLLNQTLSVGATPGSLQCKRLDIMNGGQLTSKADVVVNGTFNVKGILTFVNDNNNSFSILQAGALKIQNGGVMNVE